MDNSNEARPIAHLTRRYEFAASHRLHSAQLSAEENRRVYGKCNNPHGHGHNYGLEMTVTGPVNATTGMVANLADLDRIVQEEILDRFDHRNLNVDLECFQNTAPTAENIVIEIHRLLKKRWGGEAAVQGTSISRLRLQETGKNFFEYRETL